MELRSLDQPSASADNALGLYREVQQVLNEVDECAVYLPTQPVKRVAVSALRRFNEVLKRRYIK